MGSPPEVLEITVSYSPEARQVREWTIRLPAGSTIEAALRASGLAHQYPHLDLRAVALGVWGRRAALAQVLRHRDRIEVYRPLTVDPKVARRERFKRQGARAAGLFARRRPDAPGA